MKSAIYHLFGIFAAVWLGCQPVYSQDAPDPDLVVATVNGTDITLGHLIVLRAGLPAGYEQVPAEFLYQLILDQMIDQTLLMQSASTGPTRENKLRLENEERALISQQVVDTIGLEPPTELDLQSAYETLYPDPEGALEYSAAHILVETEDAAKELVTALESGSDFGELAKEKSTGPSGPNGGDLGWFKDGDMVQPFFDAVVELEIGQFSPPVQTQFGWHVIKLNETREQTRPGIEDIRDQLADEARQQKITARIEELKSTATIETTTPDDFDLNAINRIDLLRDPE